MSMIRYRFQGQWVYHMIEDAPFSLGDVFGFLSAGCMYKVTWRPKLKVWQFQYQFLGSFTLHKFRDWHV